MTKLKLKGNSNLLKKKTSGINQRELALAMAEATNCGAGINPLKGFISLPNFNSVTGDKEGFHGFYFVDGVLTTGTVSEIKEQINSFCTGGGSSELFSYILLESEEESFLLQENNDKIII